MNIVWFNGPSAAEFYHIPAQACEIGCNFIQRDRWVHHVCVFDPQVIAELERQGLASHTRYHTRASLATQRFTAPDSQHQPLCSGTLALVLAHCLGLTSITLLGLDWEITDHSRYDTAYTWRQHTPRKTNRHKLQLLEKLSRSIEITVVHDHARDLGSKIVWQNSRDFLEQLI